MSQFDDLIAQFRGIPSKYQSEPRQRARSLDQLMDRLTQQYKIESPRIEVQIIKNWRAIVGPNRAHRCKPSKILEGGKLIITTGNTTLRMELQFDAANILKNLHQEIGDDVIKEIIVR